MSEPVQGGTEVTPPKPEQLQSKPHPDQTAYWEKDLALKQNTLQVSTSARCVSKIALAVSILGFCGLIGSILMNSRQVSLNTEQLRLNYQSATNAQLSLRNNTQQSMTKLTMDLDQVMINHPELCRYLEGNANPAKDPTNYDRAVEVAIMRFDVYDVALGQVDSFKSEWTNPGGWTNWIIDDFARSPFLRDQYRKYSDWYGPSLTGLMLCSTNRSFYADYETNGINESSSQMTSAANTK